MLGNPYPGSRRFAGANGSRCWRGGGGKGGNSRRFERGGEENRHLSIPLHSSVPLVIMARWKDLWGPGLGRKFANFHDRARIISGWLGGFRTWQMTVVSGYRLRGTPTPLAFRISGDVWCLDPSRPETIFFSIHQSRFFVRIMFRDLQLDRDELSFAWRCLLFYGCDKANSFYIVFF